MYAYKSVTIHLGRDERYNYAARTDGSTQRRKSGTFLMLVREVERRSTRDFGTGVMERNSLQVRGRWYRADGQLSAVDATATVSESELPHAVLDALLKAEA